MMGVIHWSVLGKGPAQFSQFIRAEEVPPFPRSLRARALRHSRQLHDPMDGTQSNSLRRSMLSLIYTYNLLPQATVECKTVSTFQRQLQRAILHACDRGIHDWKCLWQCGVKRISVETFHSLFEGAWAIQYNYLVNASHARAFSHVEVLYV